MLKETHNIVKASINRVKASISRMKVLKDILRTSRNHFSFFFEGQCLEITLFLIRYTLTSEEAPIL